MRRSLVARLGSLAVGFVLVLGLLTPPTVAQETEPESAPDRSPTYSGHQAVPEPPRVGDVILHDDLVGPGVLTAGRCETGRNVGEFVGEGYIMKVTGKCRDDAPIAAVLPPPIRDLSFPDGEVRIETKAVSGQDRASFILWVRGQAEAPGAYEIVMLPARGIVALLRFGGGPPVALAERGDLASFLARDDWNSLAVRARGPDLWVLVNDQPVLAARDETYDHGTVSVGLRRTDNPDDNAETAVVVRNLRISRLAD